MPQRRPSIRGYTLIELLVVLAIVGILVIAGVSQLGTRRGPAVRSVLDELEGALMHAQQSTGIAQANVTVITDGTWFGSGSAALKLDPRSFDQTDPNTNVYTKKRIGATSEIFRSLFSANRVEHTTAAVDTDLSLYSATALGGRPGLTSTNLAAEIKTVLETDKKLFTGAPNNVVVNGISKRFMSGFYIAVVGVSNRVPYPKAPIGVLVVPENSATIFKYYLPEGGSTWQRL